MDSTVWSESKETRILWITMLAMKDANGVVECSLVGLARRAALTLEETKAAVKVLESPDTKSDSHQEYEGRRIERVERGWKVLNHEKYRGMIAKERQRRLQAEWQRGYRARKKKRGGQPLPGEAAYRKAYEDGDEAEMERVAGSHLRAGI